mmetsp:Transcript_70263/g.227483  ORF Transcript_70263/g.227483 Transcript_70263/m.227483 type:complete len:241 (+) Transcript_70263:260-982(+)
MTMETSSMSSVRMWFTSSPSSAGKPKRHINATTGSLASQAWYSTACSKTKGEERYTLPGSMTASRRCSGLQMASSQTFLSGSFPPGRWPANLAAARGAGKTPARSERLPPSVTPRCSKDVAPSLWEGCLSGFFPKRTWASTTPKCRWFRKHSARAPSRRPRPSARYASLASSRARRRPCRASTTADQQGWLTARKAMAKAAIRGGARIRKPMPASRGTKSGAAVSRCGTECQSAFRSCSS